jgi:RNA polymerase sigma-70 factor (ECF subfamily)
MPLPNSSIAARIFWSLRDRKALCLLEENQPTMEDDELMRRIQSGDRQAFDELADQYYGPLVAFFFRNRRDSHLAEDLAQETLLRVYNEAWDYLPQGRFRGWLYRIARNLLIDALRRRPYDALSGSRRALDPDTVLAQVASRNVPPAQRASGREIVALVEEMLLALPESQRTAFVLHHHGGLSLAEVAEVTETTVSTAKSRLRLAREKLRDKLNRRGVEAPS